MGKFGPVSFAEGRELGNPTLDGMDYGDYSTLWRRVALTASTAAQMPACLLSYCSPVVYCGVALANDLQSSSPASTPSPSTVTVLQSRQLFTAEHHSMESHE